MRVLRLLLSIAAVLVLGALIALAAALLRPIGFWRGAATPSTRTDADGRGQAVGELAQGLGGRLHRNDVAIGAEAADHALRGGRQLRRLCESNHCSDRRVADLVDLYAADAVIARHEV